MPSSEETQPSLKEIHQLLISIQETVSKLLMENQNMTEEISDLIVSLELSDQELATVKKTVTTDKKTIVALKRDLTKLRETIH